MSPLIFSPCDHFEADLCLLLRVIAISDSFNCVKINLSIQSTTVSTCLVFLLGTQLDRFEKRSGLYLMGSGSLFVSVAAVVDPFALFLSSRTVTNDFKRSFSLIVVCLSV